MATWTESMALTAGGTLTTTPPINLSDANAQRMIAAYRVILGLLPAATAQQVWAALSRRDFDMHKAETVNYEYQQSLAAVVKPDIVET